MWIIDETDNVCDIFPNINNDVNLFEYQKTSVKMMENFETRNFETDLPVSSEQPYSTVRLKTDIGILSNPVGSGKTLVVTALISRNDYKNYESENKEFCQIISNNISTGFQSVISVVKPLRENFHENFLDTTVIVCPLNIILQWEAEIKNKTSLTFISVKKLKEIEEATVDLMKNVNIILCSNSMYNSFTKKFSHIEWERVVIDEADSIKFVNKHMRYRFLWLITATSKNLVRLSRNTTTFVGRTLKNIGNNIDSINIRCKDEFIKNTRKFSVEHFYIECLTPYFLNILRPHLSDDIISLINAGEIEEAVKKMGGDVKTENDIIKTFNNKTKNDISDLKSKIVYITSITRMSENEKASKIKEIEKKINSLEVRLESVKEKLTEIDESVCNICFSNFENPVMVKCCNNLLCLECFRQLLVRKNNCVFCRSTLSPLDTILVTNNKEETTEEKEIVKLKQKKEECINLLEKHKNEKILLFSDQGFHEIKEELLQKKVPHQELKGGRETLERIIKKYKTGRSNLLLLSATSMGTGINLENTDVIIIYNKMSSSLQSQVTGRALRMNRSLEHKLKVYHLCHDNELHPN